jgi:D-alanyl-D-alanine carboxypeptidase
MTRALLSLLLIVGQFSVAAAPRRRAVQQPSEPVASAAMVTAARQAAEAARKAGVPAVQIAVSERGRIIYSEAFGMTDGESATAATPASVLQIGSVTKQFTAAAILRLAERGALTLEDPINKYVPEFNTLGATITLRQLLSHTAGVRPNWYSASAGAKIPAPYSPVTREQVIKSLNAGSFDFPPSKKWGYSNAGYQLLGYAIESITGMSYAEFIHSELVLPLGLTNTGVCGTSNLPLPDGYGTFQGMQRMPAVHTSIFMSGGALCSTASDLARWSHLLATGQVMLPASYATMITPAPLANNTVAPYGLGLFVVKLLGHPAVSHAGAIDGFQSSLLYFPDQDIAIAVITNAYPAPAGTDAPLIAMEIAEAALAAR